MGCVQSENGSAKGPRCQPEPEFDEAFINNRSQVLEPHELPTALKGQKIQAIFTVKQQKKGGNQHDLSVGQVEKQEKVPIQQPEIYFFEEDEDVAEQNYEVESVFEEIDPFKGCAGGSSSANFHRKSKESQSTLDDFLYKSGKNSSKMCPQPNPKQAILSSTAISLEITK